MIGKKNMKPADTTPIFDIFIIGGGINGTGIAVDAAGRGLSVGLCEQHDLGSGTSSMSSKLIHGGLRYLENYEFHLVRKALREREILLRKAPHLIHPLKFIMPYENEMRPAWLIRLGLFLYDHLGHRKILARSHKLNLSKDSAGKPLNPIYKTGFSYYDCYADDARLVIANAMQAKELGAKIFPRHQFVSTQRNHDFWQIVLQNTVNQQQTELRARVLINASGPWFDQVEQIIPAVPHTQHITLVKGSHIVVPKLYSEQHAYILQNTDKRIVFVIPFQNDYSLIGTTDVDFDGDLENISISLAEINYLCAVVNHYFQKTLSAVDTIWSYAGVRPLQKAENEKLAEITRDYHLELEQQNNLAPLLNIIGGKLTTYRELAEDALKLLKTVFPNLKPAWTATTPLPGGDIPQANFSNFYQSFRQNFPWLAAPTALRYAHQYGTRAYQLLNSATALTDLGKHFAADLYEREVEYLIQHEWAMTAEDILWRRTKLGLHFNPAEVQNLAQFLEKKSFFN